jgi:hypothetical protein
MMMMMMMLMMMMMKPLILNKYLHMRAIVCTRAVWKVGGLAAVCRCYAEEGGDLCQVVVVGVT